MIEAELYLEDIAGIENETKCLELTEHQKSWICYFKCYFMGTYTVFHRSAAGIFFACTVDFFEIFF